MSSSRVPLWSIFPQEGKYEKSNSICYDVLSTLFKQGKYSDCTIRCQDSVWNVHRNIVCLQSEVLAAAFDGSFKEATTGEIDLEDDEPEIVQLMLQFLYTGAVAIKTDDRQNSVVLIHQSPEAKAPAHAPPKTPNTTPARELLGKETTSIKVKADNTSPSPFALLAAQAPRAPFNFGTAPQINTSSVSFRLNSGGNDTGGGFGQISPSSLFGQRSPSPLTPEPPGIRPSSLGTSFSTYTNGAAPTNAYKYAKELPRLAKLYVLGEKYNIQSLKDQVFVKYRDLLPHSCRTSSFVESLELIIEGTPETKNPDPLRVLAITTAGENAKVLIDRGEFVSLCRENGSFATEILRASLGKGA